MEDAWKIKDHVGRRIAELRRRAGLTQDAVAERLGTSTPNYQRIEHGLQNVTLETMAKVANAMGAKVAEFFGPLEAPPLPRNAAPRRLPQPPGARMLAVAERRAKKGATSVKSPKRSGR